MLSTQHTVQFCSFMSRYFGYVQTSVGAVWQSTLFHCTEAIDNIKKLHKIPLISALNHLYKVITSDCVSIDARYYQMAQSVLVHEPLNLKVAFFQKVRFIFFKGEMHKKADEHIWLHFFCFFWSLSFFPLVPPWKL